MSTTPDFAPPTPDGAAAGAGATRGDALADVRRPEQVRARQDAMLGAVDVGLWYCDLPFDELAWDPKVKEHFWLPSDARVTIDTFYARIHPEDRDRTRAAIERSIAEHGPYDVEYRTVAPDGHPAAGAVRWVRAIGYTVYDAAGGPVRFDGVTVDVTATKRAEAAERAARADAEAAAAKLAAANAHLEAQQLALEVANRQLQEQAAELAAQAEELQATAAHLEEQTAAADLERRRLATLVEQLPIGVTLAEAPSGRLLLMNAAGRRLWGASAPLSAAVADYSVDYAGYYPAGHPRAGARYANADWPLARALGSGDVIRAEVIEVERAGGERVLLGVGAAPVRDAAGAIVGGVVTTEDVTERERLLEAERRARGAADAANAAKAQFLANMSHELRTPLNAIGGYVQLLDMGLHGPVTDDQRQALARVQGAQARLLALITDILNYAKLESGRVEYDLRAVDVGDVVRDVAPLVEPQMRTKGLAFDVRLPATPCRVWADRQKLGQVLVNLLSNAVKFTPSPDPRTGLPGRVTVRVATRAAEDGDHDAAPPEVRGGEGEAADDPARRGRGARVFLRIADTGIGIPRHKQDAIFEPFVQVRARGDGPTGSYAHATDGTGLGLAISRDLARGMGGDLRVRSREGAGATFTVALRRVDVPGVGAHTTVGEDGASAG